MDSRTVSRVPEWDVHPFDGGYAGLRALADSGFSGAVVADDTWLFMVNGRIIGVFDGSIDDFETAEVTAHLAPDPSLPLLFTMWELDGETRAQYYTEDTSIAEVDETLRSGSFTGYIELSENVLSGDYYVLYQAGHSMSVAFLGSSGRLVTGDEAYERANEEVGIFDVTTVDIAVVDIPETEASAADTGSSTEPEPAADGERSAPESDPSPTADDESVNAEPAAEPDALEPVEGGTDPTAASADPDGAVAAESGPSSDSAGIAAVSDVSAAITDAESDGRATDATASDPDGATSDRDSNPSAAREEPDTEDSDDGETTRSNDAFEEEKRWRETKSIPSLNPENSEPDEEAVDGHAAGAPQPSTAGASPESADGTGASPSMEPPSRSGRSMTDTPDSTLDDLRALLERRERQLQSVRDDLATAETRRDELEREVERLHEEVGDLRDEVDRLQADRDRLAAQVSDGDTDVQRTIDPEMALDGTNLFVRYRSKGAATLDAAHDGDADREAVDENLRIEYHTGFDADGVSVAGSAFDSFLHGTIEYRFVEWLVRDLLYEIKTTGHTGGLKALYDAIPEIDRAELHGNVSLRYTENGEEYREQHPFDVVVRDRMGHPLFVVDINDSREPATEKEMGSLVKAAIKTKESADQLAGAFQVTSSFFGPGALETAAEATSSGFLGGGSSESFVKLSRKRGFHLCLVETRGGDFHITVPEL